MEISQIQDDKLKQLAEDPDNIVYRYEDLPVPATIMPLSEVKQLIQELWKEFKMIKGSTTLTLRAARKIRHQLSTKSKWSSFSKTHPLIFDRIIDHQTGEKEIEALLYMIFLRELQDNGAIQNGADQLQAYIVKQFAMTADEYKAKNTDAKIIEAPNSGN
jgi:hypothetical protein